MKKIHLLLYGELAFSLCEPSHLYPNGLALPASFSVWKHQSKLSFLILASVRQTERRQRGTLS